MGCQFPGYTKHEDTWRASAYQPDVPEGDHVVLLLGSRNSILSLQTLRAACRLGRRGKMRDEKAYGNR